MTAAKASTVNASATPHASKETKMSHCSYCPMSFKKLEHAQRHERTHTLDRPYTCSSCGKTFARQDTLNRHARLHTRKAEDGPIAKGGRKPKQRASTLSPPTVINKKLEKAPSQKAFKNGTNASASSTKSSAAIARPPTSSSVLEAALKAYASPQTFSFPPLPGVVVPPSFPAYSKPADLSRGATNAHEHSLFPPQPLRRHSDIAASGLSLSAPSFGVRPRANTLAGLPEALGSFSLVGSPESNDIASSSEDDSDSNSDDDSDEDDDDEGDDSDDESSQTNSTTHDRGRRRSPRVEQIRSQYPSPAFTSCSPADLHRDTLCDLEAILANDPLHTSLVHSAQFRLGAANPEEGFDFESFAASVEGPAPGTLDDLLSSGPVVKSPEERYPTPPSASLEPHLQPHVPPIDFDFAATFQAAEGERRELATREEAAHFLHQAAQQVPSSRVVPLPSRELASHTGHFMPSVSMPCAPFNIPSLELGSPSVAPINLSSPTLPVTSLPSVSIPTSSASMSIPTSSSAYPSVALALAYASSFPSMLTIPNGLGLTAGHTDMGNNSSNQLLFNAYKRPTPPAAAFYIPMEPPPATSAFGDRTHPSSRLGLPVPAWSSVARGEGAEKAEPASFLVI